MDYAKPADVVASMIDASLKKLALAPRDLLVRGAFSRIVAIAEAKTVANEALGAAGMISVFVKAILCNWLVCLGVVMAMTSTSAVGKIAAAWLPIVTFFAQGFEHSVVNMFIIPTGMLLGFVSLYLMHAVARHRFGGAVGWLGVFAVLALVSAGVYLGRVKRWNSWDLLTQPGSMLAQLHTHLADSASLGRAVGATLAMTLLLTLAYLVFYVLMGARLETVSARRAARD